MSEVIPPIDARLSPEQTWATLFEQPIPDAYKSLSPRMMAHSIGSAYANSHIFWYANTLHDTWKKFPSDTIDSKNVFPLKFTDGTEPYGLLELHFFRDYHPEAIEIADRPMLAKLEQKLREDRVLKDNGELAGEVLFTYDPPYFKVKDGSSAIGLGVVDKDTNEPLGIIFCQSEMLPYRKTGFTSKGRRMRKPKEVQVAKRVLQPQVVGNR